MVIHIRYDLIKLIFSQRCYARERSARLANFGANRRYLTNFSNLALVSARFTFFFCIFLLNVCYSRKEYYYFLILFSYKKYSAIFLTIFLTHNKFKNLKLKYFWIQIRAVLILGRSVADEHHDNFQNTCTMLRKYLKLVANVVRLTKHCQYKGDIWECQICFYILNSNHHIKFTKKNLLSGNMSPVVLSRSMAGQLN